MLCEGSEGKDLHVCFLHAHHSDGKALKLTSRQEVDVTVPDLIEFCIVISNTSSPHVAPALTEHVCNLLHTLLSDLASLLHLMADGAVLALDSLRDLVNILRLGDGLEIVLEDLGEVVCPTLA